MPSPSATSLLRTPRCAALVVFALASSVASSAVADDESEPPPLVTGRIPRFSVGVTGTWWRQALRYEVGNPAFGREERSTEQYFRLGPTVSGMLDLGHVGVFATGSFGFGSPWLAEGSAGGVVGFRFMRPYTEFLGSTTSGSTETRFYRVHRRRKIPRIVGVYAGLGSFLSGAFESTASFDGRPVTIPMQSSTTVEFGFGGLGRFSGIVALAWAPVHKTWGGRWRQRFTFGGLSAALHVSGDLFALRNPEGGWAIFAATVGVGIGDGVAVFDEEPR